MSGSSETSRSREVELTEGEEAARMSAIQRLSRDAEANHGRRISVYSESIVPSNSEGGERGRRKKGGRKGRKGSAPRVVYHKKPKASSRAIAEVLGNSVLFQDLREDMLGEVVDAMFEKELVPNTVLIREGEDGDFFYILGKGEVEISIKGEVVQTVRPGGSFGELALLYNAPRAATCKTKGRCTVWGLDRMTFKRVLVDSDDQRRKMYIQLLSRIPLFAEMTPDEIRHIADVLNPRVHEEGDVIIKQGDKGKRFFILESGSACVRMSKGEGPEIELARIGSGDYFGEIALVNRQRRAASIIALEKCYSVSLDRDAFQRLLGPLEDVLKRNMGTYVTYESILRNGLDDKAREELYQNLSSDDS